MTNEGQGTGFCPLALSEWFLLSEWGNVTIGSEGNTTFTESPNGNFRYQKPGDASWNSATLNKIRNLISVY